MHTLSFSVMQYVVFRPLLSIIGLVCEYFNVVSVACGLPISLSQLSPIPPTP
jgi:hypothetical protein